MAFDDVKMVSYKKLENIMRNEKPYQNTSVYPLGERRYSNRHFRMRDDGAFTIHCWNLKMAEQDINIGIEPHYTSAIIHLDNSIEYKYVGGCGDVQFLSALAGGVCHSKTRGGSLHHYMKTHPLFLGLRINLESYQAVTPYVMRSRVLDKKKGRELLANYEVGSKVAMVMLESMDYVGRHEHAAFLLSEYGSDFALNQDTEMVVRLMDEHKYADALMLSLIKANWHMHRCAENGHHDAYWAASKRNIFGGGFSNTLNSHFRNKFNNNLLDGSPEVFKYGEPYEMGSSFPSSKWGYSLKDLNGKNLVRI